MNVPDNFSTIILMHTNYLSLARRHNSMLPDKPALRNSKSNQDHDAPKTKRQATEDKEPEEDEVSPDLNNIRELAETETANSRTSVQKQRKPGKQG